jgi:hypothetical protein
MTRQCLAAAFTAAILVCSISQASAAIIAITQAGAAAGNVTPGDDPGFPVEIRQPGSYRLDTNLTVSANSTGIAVFADDVTIDLNGFRIHGGDVANYGISGFPDGVTVRNGTIRNFKLDGIRLTGDRATVENMQIADNGRRGADLNVGVLHRIAANTILGNGDDGVRCNKCIVIDSVIGRNGDVGIQASGATVIGNYIYDNVRQGLASGTLGNGYAHNTLFSNDDGSAGLQVLGARQLHPNICDGEACP